MDPRGWGGVLDDQPRAVPSLVGVQSLVAAVERYIESARRDHDLGRSDVAALNALVATEHRGGQLTAGQLGDQLGLSTSATSTLIDRLTASGHVQRQRDPRDRRRTVIVATASAREVGLAMMRPLIAALAGELADLTAAEQQLVADCLGRMTSRAQQLRPVMGHGAVSTVTP